MENTKIMGILNVTLDSFYEKSRFFSVEQALEQAIQFEKEGADFIDIGGCSTRPGAEPISSEEELNRVLPVILELKKKISIPLSIDTYQYKVAKKAVENGIEFINDVTGFVDPNMRKLAAESALPICVMHMQNCPKTMQDKPFYPGGIVVELIDWFKKRIDLLLKDGVSIDQIILDPGIGFGKTVEDNYIILQELEKLQQLGFPLLLGISRKSFIQKTLCTTQDNALYGTLALATELMKQKVDILRVHDVLAHKDAQRVLLALNGVKNHSLNRL